MEKYEILENIGSGSSAEVYLVRDKLSNRKYILKSINTEAMSPAEKKKANKEATLHQGIDHPNIVLLRESFTTPDAICIVMERCSQSLDALIVHRAEGTGPFTVEDAGKPFCTQLLLEWITEIVCSVAYIHEKNILHRDIKPSNVFVTSTNHLKLGDFGVSKGLGGGGNTTMTTHMATQGSLGASANLVGTPLYLAPELCQDLPPTKASDMWSLGVLLYELIALQPPFTGSNFFAVIRAIMTQEVPPLPSTVDSRLANMVRSLLNKDPAKRLTASEIIQTTLLVPPTHPSHPDQSPVYGRSIQWAHALQFDGTFVQRSSTKSSQPQSSEHTGSGPTSGATNGSASSPQTVRNPPMKEEEDIGELNGSKKSLRSSVVVSSSSSSSDAEAVDIVPSSLAPPKRRSVVPPQQKASPVSNRRSGSQSSSSAIPQRKPSPLPKAAAPLHARGTAASNAKAHPVVARSSPTQHHPVPLSVSPSEHEQAHKKLVKEAKSRIDIKEVRSMMKQRMSSTGSGQLASSGTLHSADNNVPVMIYSPGGNTFQDEAVSEQPHADGEWGDPVRSLRAVNTPPPYRQHRDPLADTADSEEEETEEVRPRAVQRQNNVVATKLTDVVRQWLDSGANEVTLEELDDVALLLNQYKLRRFGLY